MSTFKSPALLIQNKPWNGQSFNGTDATLPRPKEPLLRIPPFPTSPASTVLMYIKMQHTRTSLSLKLHLSKQKLFWKYSKNGPLAFLRPGQPLSPLMNSSPGFCTGKNRPLHLQAAAILVYIKLWLPHTLTPVANSPKIPINRIRTPVPKT